jgi:cellobiose phosphorylase
MLIALTEMGDEKRSHEALQMLIPINHALTAADAETYHVEPYVMAADIYTNPQHAGRGGWTWYTGSAAWMLLAILKLLGYEREGDQVRLNALLGDWEEVRIELKHGLSCYQLICRRDAKYVSLDGEKTNEDSICLMDDGLEHIAVFPPRKT